VWIPAVYWGSKPYVKIIVDTYNPGQSSRGLLFMPQEDLPALDSSAKVVHRHPSIGLIACFCLAIMALLALCLLCAACLCEQFYSEYMHTFHHPS